MTTMELESLKAEAAREILNTDDEVLLKKVLGLLGKSIAKSENTAFEPVPGFPYTDEEKVESVRKSMEDIRAGRTVSMEHMRAKHPQA